MSQKAEEWPAYVVKEIITMQVQEFVPTSIIFGNDC